MSKPKRVTGKDKDALVPAPGSPGYFEWATEHWPDERPAEPKIVWIEAHSSIRAIRIVFEGYISQRDIDRIRFYERNLETRARKELSAAPMFLARIQEMEKEARLNRAQRRLMGEQLEQEIDRREKAEAALRRVLGQVDLTPWL